MKRRSKKLVQINKNAPSILRRAARAVDRIGRRMRSAFSGHHRKVKHRQTR